MPYDGIGSKLMIHKVTDFAKETSNLQKSGEIAQSHIQSHALKESALAGEQVQDIYEPSETEIKREQERKKKQGRRDGPDEPRSLPGKEEQKLPAQGAGSRIDIEI